MLAFSLMLLKDRCLKVCMVITPTGHYTLVPVLITLAGWRILKVTGEFGRTSYVFPF